MNMQKRKHWQNGDEARPDYGICQDPERTTSRNESRKNGQTQDR